MPAKQQDNATVYHSPLFCSFSVFLQVAAAELREINQPTALANYGSAIFSKMRTLVEIESEVAGLALLTGTTSYVLPTYGRTVDSAHPHVEVDSCLYHYVVVERGKELRRDSTDDFEALLYWIFADVTHALAFSYELRNRIEDQDCRRIAFPRQIELLNRIDPQMARRRAVEISDILLRAPYSDEPMKALNRMR